jgi:acyl-CoA dehydrogenase
MIENAADRGRQRLVAWQEGRSQNFFSNDHNLQEVLRLRLGEERCGQRWSDYALFGERCATVIHEALFDMYRSAHFPRLHRYDGIGQRLEQVEFHPSYHGIGQALYSTRVLSDYQIPGEEAGQLVFAYLLTQNGEAGHACPLACAAGLIKILQAVGSDALKERFLPGLLSPDYNSNFQASQFLTEIQGGSDVGSNAVEARPQGDGSYRLYGEKWFCSVANADVFLMTARPTDAPSGTRGLGAFAVPRLTDSGEPNGFRIRRLKDKLGTRMMASAEIDFEGAQGWPLGALDRGFKTIVEVVLTTSRLYNAVSCAGIMRRAFIEALSFAHARTAFGQEIARFPLVQRSLVRLKCESAAALSSTMALLTLSERRTVEGLEDWEDQFFRAAVPMNKLVTSLRANQVVHEAMEVLGGNGAIETFSVLPRLYRDSYILEAWEGTHNVLAAQILKDCVKYKIHEGFLLWCDKCLRSVESESLTELTTVLGGVLKDELRPAFEEILDDPAGPMATLRMRDLCERAMIFVQALTMAEEACFVAAEELDSEKAQILAFFIQEHGFSPAFEDDRMARILAELSRMPMAEA